MAKGQFYKDCLDKMAEDYKDLKDQHTTQVGNIKCLQEKARTLEADKAKLVATLERIVDITDRKHSAWDTAHALIREAKESK